MKDLLFGLVRRFYRRFPGAGLGLGLHDKLQPIVQRLLQPERVELDGFHLYLDPTDRAISYHLAAHGVWERHETEVFKSCVKPGMVVLDVGAHIGYFTMLASSLVGAAGRVYAFEPEPANLALLRKNVESNTRANVIVVGKGAADAPGRRVLRLDPRNKGMHSLFAAGAAGEAVEIETVALGPWLRENGVNPAFVKIDVEGAEWRVLDGMADFLSDRRPLTILLEYFPEALRRSGREPRSWLDALAALGFKLQFIDEEKKRLTRMAPAEIVAAVARSANLLCVRP